MEDVPGRAEPQTAGPHPQSRTECLRGALTTCSQVGGAQSHRSLNIYASAT